MKPVRVEIKFMKERENLLEWYVSDETKDKVFSGVRDVPKRLNLLISKRVGGDKTINDPEYIS